MYSFRQDPLVASITEGCELRIPEGKRKLWTRSREVKLEARHLATNPILLGKEYVPVLTLVALELDPSFDPSRDVAYWRDKDWENESAANVVISKGSERKASTRPKSGTPEYMKIWRANNKERMRNYSKGYRKRMAEAYKTLKQHREITTPEEAVAVSKGSQLLKDLGID